MITRVLAVDASAISFGSDEQPCISDRPTREHLEAAAAILRDTNDVVGFPTETVYGLGGSALSDESVRSIYAAKNRPADNPLIVHVSSLAQLKRRILPQGYEIPEIYTPLLERFWPGPLTILLPVLEGCPLSPLVTANQPTFAVRLPAHPVARALIALSDTPTAAPSANASTRPSPTLASHVYTDLCGKIPMILDGGACAVGVESTVVDGLVSPPVLLRPGGISVEEIRKYGGAAWQDVVVAKKTAGKLEAVRTPGMKYRHYSPRAKVVLFVNAPETALEAYMQTHALAPLQCGLLTARRFGGALPVRVVRAMGSTGAEISRNLFAMLRAVDETGVEVIFVEGIDEKDEGLAVMNRLTKAAAETIRG